MGTAGKLSNIIAEKLDVNKDEAITLEEFNAMLTWLDTAGQGYVSSKDFVAGCVRLFQMQPERARGLFLVFDFTGDNRIDGSDMGEIYGVCNPLDLEMVPIEDFRQQFVWLLTEIPFALMFSNIDRDNKGYIDDDDFFRLFDNFDTNGDKKISESEFETTWVLLKYGDKEAA